MHGCTYVNTAVIYGDTSSQTHPKHKNQIENEMRTQTATTNKMAKKLLLVMRRHQLSFSAQRAQWRAALAAARSLALSAWLRRALFVACLLL